MATSGLVFKLVLISTLMITLLLSVEGAPAYKGEENEDNVIIDQSQNGTENYRVSIKDVFFIWAPASPLLAAGAALLDSELLAAALQEAELNKPPIGAEHPIIVDFMENKPSAAQNSTAAVAPEKEKSTTVTPVTTPAPLSRSDLKAAAVIGPFLRRKH